MRRIPHALSLGLLLSACNGSPGQATDATPTASTGETSTDPAPTGGATEAPLTTGTTGEPASTSTTDTTDAPASTSTATAESTAAPTPTTGAETDTGGEDVLACPPAIDAAISACVTDLQADPELADNNFLLDLLLMCADAEPVADDYDAHCAGAPDDPICDLDYRTFVTDVLPQCVLRVQDDLFADVCLLPEQYADLLFTPSIALMQRRTITAAADLSASEQQQLVAASVDMGLTVATAAEALLAADGARIEQQSVLDVGTDRAMVFYTGDYGGVQRGRGFFRGTGTRIGAVEDGLLLRCAVERGIEGQPCETDAPCAPDHSCNDILLEQATVLAPGACIFPEYLPGEGDSCNDHDDCVPADGLLCIDAMDAGDPAGTCRPGWMRRSFAGQGAALQPGGDTVIDILTSGIATVPTAAYLDLTLTQTQGNLLTLQLLNPTGTLSPVAMTSDDTLHLDLAQVFTPSDESAGGVWQLIVHDAGGQASGQVHSVALTLDTRWD